MHKDYLTECTDTIVIEIMIYTIVQYIQRCRTEQHMQYIKLIYKRRTTYSAVYSVYT